MFINDQNQTPTDEKVVEVIANEKQADQEQRTVETDESVETDEMKTEQKEEVEKKAETEETEETEEKEEFETMLNESFSKFQKGEIIEGIVVRIDDKDILVDIGLKSETAIPIKEFSSDELPNIGDKIKLYIDSETSIGQRPILSKRKADFIIKLPELEEIMEKNLSIKGVFKRRIKGGMIVEIIGLEAFLPGSQISLKPVPNLDQFIGKEKDFKIIKIDNQRRNIILSRTKLLKEEKDLKLKELKHKLIKDFELIGEVRNITNYGAFVDLGGIDGLLHITDMSWGHIKHPSDILNIGDKIKIKILNYDDATNKVSLGMKQLVPHPWENIEAKYPEGSIVSGKVVNLTKYGAFVELEPGVEGLVHVTELSWVKKIRHPKQMLKVGETIKAIILTASKEDRRISLGVKQMDPNPWISLEEKYPEGSIINVNVKNVSPFGVFCEIEDDIEGMIHISDISWTKRIYNPKKIFKKGDKVEVMVLHIDKALHRIALGIKQLKADPWERLDEKLPINRELTAKIVKLIPKGVLVDVPVDDDYVEGFVPLSHLAVPGLSEVKDAFQIEEEIPLKIIELDLENRRLILSVKAYFFAKGKNKMDEYLKLHLERMNLKKEKEKEKEALAKAKKEMKEENKTEDKTEIIEEKTKVIEEIKTEEKLEEKVEEKVETKIEEVAQEQTDESEVVKKEHSHDEIVTEQEAE